MKRTLSLCLAAFVALLLMKAGAQTLATQFYEVPAMFNPSVVGTTPHLNIRAIGRIEAAGLSGAPFGFAGLADMPLNNAVGIGMAANAFKSGDWSFLAADAQCSYKLRTPKGLFSIGLQGGPIHQRYTLDEAKSATALDLGLGLGYWSERFWIGASGLHLTSPRLKIQDGEIKIPATFYFVGGGNISLKNTFIELMPSVLVKANAERVTGIANIRARYKRLFSFGVGYRWKEAVCASVAIELKNFSLGYSYDYITSCVGKNSSGNHEIFVGYSLRFDLNSKNKYKHKSIRLM